MVSRSSTTSVDDDYDDLEDGPRGRFSTLSSSSSLGEDPGPEPEQGKPVFETVRINPHNLVHLRESLKDGVRLKASFDVGDFIEGAQLLAGLDLNLEAFDIIGLQDGDEIDHSLEHIALEALAGLADEGQEVQLAMRPVFVVQELAEKAKKEKTDNSVPARMKNCCLALLKSCCQKRKWRRRRRCKDRIRNCCRAIEACVLRCCFSRASTTVEKRYDVFLCAEMGDRDLAHWVIGFCHHRSWTVFHDSPCEQVRKFLKRQRERALNGEEEKDDPDKEPIEDRDDDASASGGGNTARTGTSSGSGRSKQTNIPCLEWLRRRRTAIGASKIVILVLNNDCFENAFVVQDCAWAYFHGIPILPICRFDTFTNIPLLRRQIPCCFRLGVGVPSAGPGCNRQILSAAITRAIVKSLLTSRLANKNHKLPAGTKQQFIFSCKKLGQLCKAGALEEFDQFDEFAEEEEEEEEKALDQEQGEEEKPEKDEPEEAEAEDPMAADGVAAKALAEKEGVTLAQLREAAEAEHAEKQAAEEAQREYEARMERLSLQNEERVYGVISAIALHGTHHQQITVDGVDALRRVSRIERGCITLAEFSGITIIMRCAHSANRYKGRVDRRGRRNTYLNRIKRFSSRVSSRMSRAGSRMTRKSSLGVRLTALFALGSYDGLGGEGKPPSRWRYCCICFICCLCCIKPRRNSTLGSSSSMGSSSSIGDEKRSCLSSLCCCCCRKKRQGRSSSRVSVTEEKEQSATKTKIKHCCFFVWLRCCMRRQSGRESSRRGSVVEGKTGGTMKFEDNITLDEMIEDSCCLFRVFCGPCLGLFVSKGGPEGLANRQTFTGKVVGSQMKRMSYMTAAFARIFRSHAKKHLETMGVAENSLACLRNLACRSTDRKSEILNSGGAIIAVKAMKVFADTEGDGVKRAAAGLLRNLSAEVNRGPPILYQAGVLAVAKEELAEATVTTDTERHLLATVQNMAAHQDAAVSYFRGGDSERWLAICAQVVDNARGDKATKILQQALSALANLARVRTVESQMADEERKNVFHPGDLSSRAGEDKKSLKSSKSFGSGASKTDMKATTAEELDGSGSEKGDSPSKTSKSPKSDKASEEASEHLSPMEARKRAALRAAAEAKEEEAKKAPEAKPKRKSKRGKKKRKTKRSSQSEDEDEHGLDHEGLDTDGWGESDSVLKASGWGESIDGEDGQLAPKRKPRSKAMSTEASEGILAQGLHDMKFNETNMDASIAEDDEEDASDEDHDDEEEGEEEDHSDEDHEHEGEESEEEDYGSDGDFEEMEHSGVGHSTDDAELYGTNEHSGLGSGDDDHLAAAPYGSSVADVEFHSEFQSHAEQEESEEEKAHDEVAEVESLPTDDKNFDESLEMARTKVPEKVLESMLHLLTEETKNEPTAASALTVAATIAALCNFAQDVDVERSIGELGGLETVLGTMINFEDAQVHLQGLRFFLNMSFSHHNQERLILAGVLPFTFNVLESHRAEADAEIQEQGCGLLRNLATGPARQKAQIFRQGATAMLVRTLQDYPTHPGACRQAAAAIRILADGAPPVADQVCEADGMAALITALRKTGDDPDLTEQVLHAVEFVLVTPAARRPFCRALGHLDVLNSMERFTMNTTILRACRTLAGALCLHENFQDTDLTESEDEEVEETEEEILQRAGGSAVTVAALKKEKAEKLKRKKEEGPMRRKPSFRMRLDLAEQGAVDKLCSHLETFSEHLDVLEAVVGALRNLILDLPGMKNMGLKQTVGLKAPLLIRTVSLWVDRVHTRREAMRFVALMFTLLASLSLNKEAGVLLHRQGAAEKALDWMAIYNDDAVVQCTGCAFLKNFAGAQLRVRAEIVECGGVKQISEILARFLDNHKVLEEGIRALHNFAMADGCGEECAENLVVRRTLAAVRHHPDIAQLNWVGFALLWNVSTTNIVASAIVVQDGVQSALEAIARFHDEPKVIGNAAGMMRNLLAGQHKEAVSRTISHGKSYGDLRGALYRHSQSVLVAEQMLGCLSNIAQLKGEHLEILANEMMNPKEADALLNLLEQLHENAAVQYQGFSLIARLVSYDRERKRAFNIVVPHSLQMLVMNRNTPVVDVIDACLEEIG